jgi:hypothetical protein
MIAMCYPGTRMALLRKECGWFPCQTELSCPVHKDLLKATALEQVPLSKH